MILIDARTLAEEFGRESRSVRKFAKMKSGKKASKVAGSGLQEKLGQNNNSERNIRISHEVVLPKVKTYEQARNKAFEILGDLGSDSKPIYGRLKTSAGNGKIIGRQTADKKALWRLDYDPNKGIHINVEDYRNGKGVRAVKKAIPFEGDESLFMALLDHLNS